MLSKSFFFILLTVTILFSCSVISTQKSPIINTEDTIVTVSIDSTYAIDTLELVKVNNEELAPYQPAREKIVDLVHTTLDLKIDWEQEKIYGYAIVSVSPHFHSINKVQLDALGLYVNSIILKTDSLSFPLNYTNNNYVLEIDLGCTFSKDDTLTLEINYNAIPSTLYDRGITNEPYKRGLSFVHAEDTEDGIWPQTWSINQVNSASCWFPTIDSPNQRMTQDLYITVHDRLMALSNGELIYSTLTRADSSRTFYWKVDKPQPPYLTSLNIGNFAKVEDKWNDVNVEYYVSKKYESEARNIFGNTPEMIDLFSTLFKTPYTWKKYGQVAVSNYMYGGAMENNTLTIFHDFIQTNARERLDDNNEGITSHELGHQWFGNYVTCEAWSNLTLNESFATYCEYLWYDYKYGKTEAEIRLYDRLNDYLIEAEFFLSPTIQYHYNNSEWDVFNSHTYDKGSLILHQLRKLLGDDVFFESVHQYLKNNAYNSVNIFDLQKAFEEVSGKDLKQFFNQWYFQKGHPELLISSKIENENLIVNINQKQVKKDIPLFSFPVELEMFFANGEKFKKEIHLSDENYFDTIKFIHKPEIVKINNEKTVLAQCNYENYLLNYELAFDKLKTFSARKFILNSINRNDISDSMKIEILQKLVQDSIWKIRELACGEIQNYITGSTSLNQRNALLELFKSIAANDKNSSVRAEAINCLGQFEYEKVKLEIQKAIQDSSYWVMSKALSLLFKSDYETAFEISKQLSSDEKFSDYLLEIYSAFGKANCNDMFLSEISKRKGNDKFEAIDLYSKYIRNQKNDSLIQIAFNEIKSYAMNSKNWEIRRHSIMLLSSIIDTSKDVEKKEELNNIISNEKEKRVFFGVGLD